MGIVLDGLGRLCRSGSVRIDLILGVVGVVDVGPGPVPDKALAERYFAVRGSEQAVSSAVGVL